MRGDPVKVGSVVWVLSALLIALVDPAVFAQTRTALVTNELAKVYRIDLPAHTQTAFKPMTAHGLVWVAITDGTVVIGGVAKEVKQGAATWEETAVPVSFRAPDKESARFVIVDLTPVCEDVGILNLASPFAGRPYDPTKNQVYHDESLAPGNALQEDSVQQSQLFVAVAPLLLIVQMAINRDDEPVRWSEPTLLNLTAGEVRWTKPGRHLFTNGGKTNARFVMVWWSWRPPIRE